MLASYYSLSYVQCKWPSDSVIMCLANHNDSYKTIIWIKASVRILTTTHQLMILIEKLPFAVTNNIINNSRNKMFCRYSYEC